MKKVFFLLPILLILACKTSKPAAVTEEVQTLSCQTKATVIDRSSLDGCQYLLQVENGEKWLPMEISDPNFKFHDQQSILFDYEEVEDYMSICMAENKGVNITCIKELAAANLPLACTEVPNILKTGWIQKTIREKKIFHITQYKDNSQFVYLFKANSKRYLYDCKGKAICDFDKNAEDDCTKKISSLTNEYVIWVQNQ